MKLKKICSVVVAAALTFSLSVTPILADEVSDLKKQKKDTEEQVNSLQTQLNSLMTKISELENDLITCVASDAHRSYVRTPHMKEVRDHLTRNGGFEYTYHLLEGNPRRIISNRQIPAHGRRPERLRRYYW